jgi:uncharacterized membrane protein YjgN (DUF898 family)
MVKILWGIIGVWSLIVLVDIIIDWEKWKPTEDTLGGAIKSVMQYRIKMLIKMIIPAALLILSAMAVFL